MVEALLGYIGCTKGLQTWFHAAHHVTKGTAFASDHVNLYGEIYTGISEDLDKLVEKSIMVADNEEVACPVMITITASKVLERYESPVNKNADIIVTIGLDYMRNHIENLAELYSILEKNGALSLGMGDYLASAANQYEGYVYLLTQRIKKGQLHE
jgi:DNA-binding ferritin-like protein